MYSNAVQELIDELGRLPGVGPKSAQRIAFHLLKVDREDAVRLARAVTTVKDRVSWCRRCFNIAETDGSTGATVECGICADTRRDPTVVLVVEEPKDVVAMEKTREFHGRYHVLQGTINHLDGIGPDKLRIRELLGRIAPEGIEEVILGLNPTIEGEATTLYLTNLLADLPVRATRLASGLPMGADLEYADEITLARALEGRRPLGG